MLFRVQRTKDGASHGSESGVVDPSSLGSLCALGPWSVLSVLWVFLVFWVLVESLVPWVLGFFVFGEPDRQLRKHFGLVIFLMIEKTSDYSSMRNSKAIPAMASQ